MSETSGKGSTKLLNRIKELEDKSTKGADFIKKLKKKAKELKAKELKAKELKAKNVEFEARLDRYEKSSQMPGERQTANLTPKDGADLESQSESEMSSEPVTGKLEHLAPELILIIATYLSVKDLVRLSHVNGHLFRTLSGFSKLWTGLFEKSFTSTSPLIGQVLDKIKQENPSWSCFHRAKLNFILHRRAWYNWRYGSYKLVCAIEKIERHFNNLEKGIHLNVRNCDSFVEIQACDLLGNKVKQFAWTSSLQKKISTCKYFVDIEAVNHSFAFFSFLDNGGQKILIAVNICGDDYVVQESWTRKFDSYFDQVLDLGKHIAIIPRQEIYPKMIKVLDDKSGNVILETGEIESTLKNMYKKGQNANYIVFGRVFSEKDNSSDHSDLALFNVKDYTLKSFKISPKVARRNLHDAAGDRFFVYRQSSRSVQIWDLHHETLISEVGIGCDNLSSFSCRGPSAFCFYQFWGKGSYFVERDQQFKQLAVLPGVENNEFCLLFDDIIQVKPRTGKICISLASFKQNGLEKEYELEELCAHLEMRKERVHPFVYRKITPSILEISFGGKIFIFDFLNIK